MRPSTSISLSAIYTIPPKSESQKKDQKPQINISFQMKENTIELSFKDNGIGFDEKYMPRMFALFQRLHSRENYEGTGLGLAICRKIVEIHQGQIWASAKEGEGATFYVSLPLNIADN